MSTQGKDIDFRPVVAEGKREARPRRFAAGRPAAPSASGGSAAAGPAGPPPPLAAELTRALVLDAGRGGDGGGGKRLPLGSSR